MKPSCGSKADEDARTEFAKDPCELEEDRRLLEELDSMAAFELVYWDP